MDALARPSEGPTLEIRTAQGMGLDVSTSPIPTASKGVLYSTQRSSSNWKATRKTPTRAPREASGAFV